MQDEDPLILSIDSATSTRSVALLRGEHLLAHVSAETSTPNSVNILGDVDHALAQASVRLSEVDVFAVAMGPGSFTGLRAGLATMKALAMTLRKPLVGVPTLHAVAHAARPGSHIVAAIPAGRGEVFAQTLGAKGGGEVIEHDAPAHVAPSVLLDRAASAGKSLKWAVCGTESLTNLIAAGAERAGFRLVELTPERKEPGEGEWMIGGAVETLAQSVAELARGRYSRGQTFGAGELQALYVRASDAELKSNVTG